MNQPFHKLSTNRERGFACLLRLGCVLAVAWLAFAPAVLPAQEPEETPPLDLLEGIEEPPEEETPAEPEPPAGPPNSAEEIAERMQQVESRLREADAGEQTQAMQEEIIAALDKVIEDLRKSGGGQSSNPPPSAGQSSGSEPEESLAEQEPSQEGDAPPNEEQDLAEGEEQERDSNEAIDESTERSGHEPGEEPGILESRPNLLRQAWGHLPGHAAEAMPNAATEQFLPEYQREIESYFRRLNEEQLSDSL